LAERAKIGSSGLRILPFGNGAERMLYNQNRGSSILNLNFNSHGKEHLLRASLEGIAFSFVYGLEILVADGVGLDVIKAGNDNLFQADIFSHTIATLTGSSIKILETTGAVGAARAAALAYGDFSSLDEASAADDISSVCEPLKNKEEYMVAYDLWKHDLNEYLK
ncbi:MAG TPA: FGGY-family carbohydrate kinase, partial [Roseivirga sp.]